MRARLSGGSAYNNSHRKTKNNRIAKIKTDQIQDTKEYRRRYFTVPKFNSSSNTNSSRIFRNH